MMRRSVTLAIALGCLAPGPSAAAQDGAEQKTKDDKVVQIDAKWLERWKEQKIDVARLLDDLAETGIAAISATYARDMAADEPKARRVAMAALTALAMAGPNEVEAHGAIRVLERFAGLKEERAGAPELFQDIAKKLRPGKRRCAAAAAWVRALCALERFDEARAAITHERSAAGEHVGLLAGLPEEIRVADVRSRLVMGKTPPALTGAALTGETVDTAAWKGEVVVVWYWSRDTKASLMRLREMNELAAQFEPKGVRWLGVAVDRDPKAVRQFALDSGITWTTVCQDGGWDAPIVQAWAVAWTPALWVLGKDGTVRGIDLHSRKALVQLLSTLLAEKPGEAGGAGKDG